MEHTTPFSFSVMPSVLLANDFAIRREALGYLPWPLFWISPEGEGLWANAAALDRGLPVPFSTKLEESSSAGARRAWVEGEQRRIAARVVAVHNLVGALQGFLGWLEDETPYSWLEHIDTGLAVAREARFRYGNRSALALLAPKVTGMSGMAWAEVEGLPPWPSVELAHPQGRLVANQGPVQLRIHRIGQDAVLEAIPVPFRIDDGISGEAAASLMHELRNPLTAIAGYLELAESKTGDAVVRGWLAEASRQVERLSRLSEDLLWLTRPLQLDLRWVELRPLVESAWNMVDPKLREPLRFQVELELARVVADRDRLFQVLLNLLKNAAEALASGSGTVSVKSRREPQAAVISVSDDGPGIPDQVLRHLFNMVTTKSEGIGLGLAIAQRLVQAHGGELSVTTGPTGTTFSIQLPWQELAQNPDPEAS
jgi:two-component system sensor histidine kinase HydH